MLKDRYPYYLANRPVSANADLPVIDKFTGEVVTRVALASDAVVDEALAHAVRAGEPMKALASYERRDIINHCVARFTERRASWPRRCASRRGNPSATAAARSTG